MYNVVEIPLDLKSFEYKYVTSTQVDALNTLAPASVDVAVVFTPFDETFNQLPFRYNPAIHDDYLNKIYQILDKVDQVVAKTGTLYIYGLAQWLPYFSVYLDEKKWQFKYWLAVETQHPPVTKAAMVNTHQGILLYVKNKTKFNLRKVRSPHQKCDVCGDFTADWGGKKHLRNPLGYAISDVWDDLPQPVLDHNHIFSKEVWQRLLLLTANDKAHILCINYDGEQNLEQYIFE
jgi:hypothetical protein